MEVKQILVHIHESAINTLGRPITKGQGVDIFIAIENIYNYIKNYDFFNDYEEIIRRRGKIADIISNLTKFPCFTIGYEEGYKNTKTPEYERDHIIDSRELLDLIIEKKFVQYKDIINFLLPHLIIVYSHKTTNKDRNKSLERFNGKKFYLFQTIGKNNVVREDDQEFDIKEFINKHT